MGAFCLDVARPLPWRPFHPFWSVLKLSSSSPQQEDSALMTSVLQFSHLQEVRTQKDSEEFTQVFSTSVRRRRSISVWGPKEQKALE